MRIIKYFLYFSLFMNLFLVLLWTRPVCGESLVKPTLDYSKLRVYLLTVDVGVEPHLLFGHTVIRVKDTRGYMDVVYNWGVFDFNEDNFVLKFLKGDLKYKVEAYPYFGQVRAWERQRTKVWQDELNLTLKQKQRLIEKITWNLKPENKEFHYLYFERNCSTYPRDYIDMVLGGNVKFHFFNKKTQLTFRQDVMNHVAVSPFIKMGLDMAFNSRIDKIMTAWEDMYKPAALRKYLMELPALDDSYNAIPHEKLLKNTSVIVDFPSTTKVAFDGYQILFVIMLIPLLLVCLIFIFRPQKSYLRFLGFLAFVFGVLSFVASLAFLFFEFISSQENAFHNAGLFVFWPTDLIISWWGLKWILFGRAVKVWKWYKKYINLYCFAHIFCSLLLLALWQYGFILQDVANMMIYFVSIQLVMMLLVIRRGFSVC